MLYIKSDGVLASTIRCSNYLTLFPKPTIYLTILAKKVVLGLICRFGSCQTRPNLKLKSQLQQVYVAIRKFAPCDFYFHPDGFTLQQALPGLGCTLALMRVDDTLLPHRCRTKDYPMPNHEGPTINRAGTVK